MAFNLNHSAPPLPNAYPEKFHVRLPPGLLDRMAVAARQEGMSRPDYARHVLRTAVSCSERGVPFPVSR